MTDSSHWPEELHLKREEKRLEVSFSNGSAFSLTAEYLRVMSPSAEVQGHGPGQAKTVAGARQVAIRQIEPVGNYAVRLHFDDGHDTGLYSWDILYKLGVDQDKLWADYLNKLEKEGLSRDPT